MQTQNRAWRGDKLEKNSFNIVNYFAKRLL